MGIERSQFAGDRPHELPCNSAGACPISVLVPRHGSAAGSFAIL